MLLYVAAAECSVYAALPGVVQRALDSETKGGSGARPRTTTGGGTLKKKIKSSSSSATRMLLSSQA